MTLIVNGEQVEDQEIQREMDRLRPHYEQSFPDRSPEEREGELREWSRENVIERILLMQASEREFEPTSAEEVEAEFEKMARAAGGRKHLLARLGMEEEDGEGQVKREIDRRKRFEKLIERLMNEVEAPSDEEMRKFYEENIGAFAEPEMVRASHIVKHHSPGEDPEKVKEEMQKVVKKLRNNGFFTDLVSEHSDCPDRGGDLGFFPRGQMVQEFEDVVFQMEPGEVSDVFVTEFGHHIAMVTEKKPANTYPFEEVKEKAAKGLIEQLRQKKVEVFVDTEKAKAKIEG
ncbi:peptidylprolyl isomerase [bacterium]|nr:peptidylprolyl isomerase [bacterium]